MVVKTEIMLPCHYPARACVSRGLCDRGWCPYICTVYVCGRKKLNRTLSDRLAFSNIRSRTSRRIFRLAIPLRAPETLSSLSKSSIFICHAHRTLFVHRMKSDNSIGKYHHLVIDLEFAMEWSVAVGDQTSRIVAELERSECGELHLR